MLKLLDHMKVMSSIDDFAMWYKLDQYASFSIQKTVSMVLLAEGIVCYLFCWAMLCDTIPCSVILF